MRDLPILAFSLRWSHVLALLALIVAASLLSPYFFDLRNIMNVLRGASVLCIVAVGMTLVILSRGVDLSAGSILGMSGATLALMTACSVGPDYVRPSMISPDAYKELDGWKIAHPRDDLARGPWWEIFADPQLNALEARVSISNQNLAVAEAQYQMPAALWAVGPCLLLWLCRLWLATAQRRPAFRVASTIRSHSATLRAIGFSM